MFQFLIGTVLLDEKGDKLIADPVMDIKFQFLIGTVLPSNRGGTYDEFRIVDVSIPYRYGITTVFSPFSGTVFFFSPQISLKSLSTSHFYYRKFP